MKKFVLVLLPLLFFISCHNDLKLNAPYREIPSIYAVLCPQDNLHMIRVNKVFLGEGDANVMAKVADSVNYPAGELSITLDRYVNGKQDFACPTQNIKTIIFHDSLIQTNPGAFSTTQRVYVANADLHQALPYINPDKVVNPFGVNSNANWKVFGDYVLTVKNNRTGNVFKAKSTIVDSIKPNQLFAPFVGYFYPPAAGAPANADNFISYQEPEKIYTITYPINEGKIYQVLMRFHFYDDLGAAGRWPFQFVDFPFANQNPDQEKTTLGPYSIMRLTFKGKDIMSQLGLALGRMSLSDNILARKVYKMEYFVYSSTQEFADYLEFSKPSFGVSQTKPLYSNFENQSAIGIFTFRARCKVAKALDNAFISEFQRNSNTCKFNFFNADESRHGCP